MVQRVSSSGEYTLTLIQNSILKKSKKRVIYDKIFPKNRQLVFSDAVMVSKAKCPVT